MTPEEFVEAPKTGRVYQVKLPLRIQSSKKKTTAINLNIYRNLHFRSLTAQKKNFAKIAKKLLQGIPALGVIGLHYSVHPQTKRRMDIGNVVSILDKYFSDCLTENHIIEDDNYEFLPFVSSGFGGIVEKEFVLVTITELISNKKGTPMRILLDDNDIQIALETYVETLGISGASGVKIEATADGNITAEVMMGTTPAEDPVPTPPADKPKAKPRNKGGRPPGAKNKPKVETNVETVGEDSPSSSPEGSGEASPEPTPETTTPPAGDTPEASTAKNLFGASPEASSETTEAAAPDEKGVDSPEETVTEKPKSIFG